MVHWHTITWKIEKKTDKFCLPIRWLKPQSGQYTVAQLAQSFAPYLIANRNTEKHTLHISLNPDPKDIVNDDKFREMAQQYMREMGYGEQPLLYSNILILTAAIHIVSVCGTSRAKRFRTNLRKCGRWMYAGNWKKQYHLIPATDKERNQTDKVFRPVDYRAGDVKKSKYSVVRHLPNYYQYQTLGIQCPCFPVQYYHRKIEGELQGKMQQGLLYIPLNEKAKEPGIRSKASFVWQKRRASGFGIAFCEMQNGIERQSYQADLKSAVTIALKTTSDEQAFKSS